MATKTTGIELKAFYDDKKFWPDGTYHEDESITIDGILLQDDDEIMKIADAACVIVDGGIVFDFPGDEPSFEGHFKRWRKMQTTLRAAFECQKEKMDAVIDAIVAAGGKVIK